MRSKIPKRNKWTFLIMANMYVCMHIAKMQPELRCEQGIVFILNILWKFKWRACECLSDMFTHFTGTHGIISSANDHPWYIMLSPHL